VSALTPHLAAIRKEFTMYRPADDAWSPDESTDSAVAFTDVRAMAVALAEARLEIARLHSAATPPPVTAARDAVAYTDDQARALALDVAHLEIGRLRPAAAPPPVTVARDAADGQPTILETTRRQVGCTWRGDPQDVPPDQQGIAEAIRRLYDQGKAATPEQIHGIRREFDRQSDVDAMARALAEERNAVAQLHTLITIHGLPVLD